MYNDIRKKNIIIFLKWLCYSLCLFFFYCLQTVPHLFALASEIKPVLIVTICVAVALTEFEFSGAIFGAVGGMMWDISAGRQAGFFTITLMICCFFIGYSVRVFFRSNYFNIMVMTFATMFVVTALDFLFGYVIFNYAAKSEYYFGILFPICIYTAAVSPFALFLAKKINKTFDVDK